MELSALVIGYGSIGRRHARLLSGMDGVSMVSVLSSQTGLTYETLSKLEDVPDLNPDYIVVASPTSMHFSQLQYLDANIIGKKILVEKPLFDKMKVLRIANNYVSVAYNLRFHPLIQKIKQLITGRKIWSIHVFCGSYLPDWRPGQDYSETSSAHKVFGGGVLLDLSHELDYVQWLVGPLKVTHSVSDKVSGLAIDTDDLLLLSAQSKRDGVYVHIALNYFTRVPVRRIILDGEGVSIQGDLIANTLLVTIDGNTSSYEWPELDRNSTYLAQHRALMNGNRLIPCNYEEGLQTMGLIDEIRNGRSAV